MGKMKQPRMVRYITTVLRENGDMTMQQIATAIKEKWPRSSPTPKSLSNILAKYPEFMVVESTKSQGSAITKGTYDVNIWGLSE